MKWVAYVFILVGLGFLLAVFGPVLKEEIKYNFDQVSRVKYVVGTEQLETFEKPLTPPNTDFSIIIPAIGATAPIIDNVDATNPEKYLPALRLGIAHAMGAAYPDDVGNVFLFAHSADSLLNVNTYNATFFLIGKLQNGSVIDIYYGGNLYKYQVYDKKVVDANSTQYFGPIVPDEKTLTLETGFPAGTTFQRLLVFAKEIE